TGQSDDEPFWPESNDNGSGNAQKTESEKSIWGTAEDDDSLWGNQEEGDSRAGQSFEESYEEGDNRAGQSFEESREGYDSAPSEIHWEQGDVEWIADGNTLRIVNEAFYMDESILGMPYDFANTFFGGDLPLLDAWDWDNRFTGYCNYYYMGHWYTFFFTGENLTAVRYEVEGDDVEKFLSKYIDSFGGYGYRKDPNTGADIGLNENGYGYVMNANYSTLAIFLNIYDDLPHIAMQYEYWTSGVQILSPEDEGNDSPPATTKTTTRPTENDADDSALESAPKPTSNGTDDNAMYFYNSVFFMDTFYLGCEYDYVKERFGGDLPLLDAWIWDERFTGYCDYYYNGHWYTLLFNDETLAAVRYEFEGDDIERFLDPYIERYGQYVARKDPVTGEEIGLYENGYGYKFNTGEGSVVVFLNVYDGVPHIAMQYEMWY
ncbi:MAG: hypothetical protein J5494_04825, partial [Candidatus Methanomethylophilaceae archaeon]|nr:hypothetical protein [Candidatus Methanomethylophilaceae archaeon]